MSRTRPGLRDRRGLAFGHSMIGGVATLVGVLLVAFPVTWLVSDRTPPAAPPVVPLRSPLASLPETLGEWTRALNTLGEPIEDTRFNQEMLECVGTDHVLQRRYEHAGRQVTIVLAHHTGEALEAVPMVPERDWVTMHSSGPSHPVDPIFPSDGIVGSRQLRSGEIIRLPSGLEVSLTVARPTWNSDGRLLGACVLLIDGASSASWRDYRKASTWWARVEVHAYRPDTDPSAAFDTFVTDIDDLMPRVVAELQNTCLPLPVEAVPTD